MLGLPTNLFACIVFKTAMQALQSCRLISGSIIMVGSKLPLMQHLPLVSLMWTQSIQGRCSDQVGLHLCCRVQIGFAVCTQWQQHKLPWSLVLDFESIALQWQHCSSNIAMILWQHCISEILWQHCSTCDSIAYQLLLEKGMCNNDNSDAGNNDNDDGGWEQQLLTWLTMWFSFGSAHFVSFHVCFRFVLVNMLYMLAIPKSNVALNQHFNFVLNFLGGKLPPSQNWILFFHGLKNHSTPSFHYVVYQLSWLHCIMAARSAK